MPPTPPAPPTRNYGGTKVREDPDDGAAVAKKMATMGGPSDDGRSNPQPSPEEIPPMHPRCLASILSVADAFLPPLSPPGEDEEDRDDSLRRFYGHSLRSDPSYADALRIAVMTKISAEDRTKLLLLLHLLSTPLGTMALLGFHPYAFYLAFLKDGLRGFSDWDLDGRVWALGRLRDGVMTKHREIFAGLKRLTCAIALTYVRDEGVEDGDGGGPPPPDRLNPYWEAMGYRGPIHRYLAEEDDRRLIEESGQYDFRREGAILNVDSLASSSASVSSEEEDRGGPLELEYDVVIAGSGAGGGVAASVLASAGYSVLVLEKGPYLEPSERNDLEASMLDRQYEGHSLLTTADANFMILAGSTLGGATSINWACCLEPPRHVVTEWFDCHRREEYAKSMEKVKERIGVSTKEVRHNAMNAKFMEGCKAAGYECSVTGQNLRDTGADSVGYTCFGDRYGNKRGGMVTFLADACRAGARILPDCAVDSITQKWESQTYYIDGVPKRTTRRRAVGVSARAVVTDPSTGRRKERALEIKARRCVISACGALNTPCLLLRSGSRNRHIGRHLHLHPVTAVLGAYDRPGETKPPPPPIETTGKEGERAEDDGRRIARRSPREGLVSGYLGAPMTAVSNQFQHGPDESGYGAKLECPSAHTGLNGAGMPWMAPLDFRRKLLLWKDAVTLIVLQRDRSEGRVTLAGDGFSPKVEYRLNREDRRSMTDALVGAVRVLIASGCGFVSSAHHDPGLRLEEGRESTTDCGGGGGSGAPSSSSRLDRPEVETYLDRLRSLPWDPFKIGVFSAHQMGSCRMGPAPADSACDDDGELWECDDLYVLDTSLFPSASGSNPMLSVLALSHMLSTKLALRLRYEDSKLSGSSTKTGEGGGGSGREAMEAEDLMRVREERRVLGMVHGPPREMPEWLETTLHATFWVVAAAVLAAAVWDAWKELADEEEL